jgi:universal stress protein E
LAGCPICGENVMGSIQRILVAVEEPTSACLPAVAKAAQIARALGADLELFHAIDSAIYIEMLGCAEVRAHETEMTVREQYLQRLERIASRLRLHAVKVTVAAEWDYPGYAAIARRAEHIGADLIVAGTRGGEHNTLLTRLADWELVRFSPLPVLLVRSSHLYRRPTVLAALGPSQGHGKPKNLDRGIVRLGVLLSSGLKGELHAAHAYERLTGKSMVLALARGLSVTQASAAEARTDFDWDLHVIDVARSRRHLLEGRASEALPRLAERLKADIMVVGAVSRTYLQRLFIGDTAERLLHDLSCDLLVVKAEESLSGAPSECRSPRGVGITA